MSGGKGKVKSVKAPDYNELISKQATVNRVNQISPFGNITYSGPDKSTQTVTLSPEMQQIFGGAVGQALDRRTLGAPEFDSGLNRQAIVDALYGRSMSLVEPQFAQRERSIRQNLADRGLVEGSEAYNNMLNMELDAQNRARSDAALSAVIGGDQAWNQERNYALNRDQVAGQADQIDFNQLAALLGATPQSGVNPVDVTGSAGLNIQGQMANNQTQLAKSQQSKGLLSDIIGGGSSIAAASMFASDVRLKTNIRFVEHRNGLNWYTWDWKDGSGSSFGVIAQEVQSVKPDAVGERDGFLTVNYGALV
jgi:hypothetical protein